MCLEIRHLRYFIQVYDSGSILKAADKLFISQQALSKSLATLEKELGAPLFYRTAKGMVPTQLGQAFSESCRSIVKNMDDLTASMEKMIRLGSGHVRIGLSGGFLYLGSKKIWSDFHDLYPQTEVETIEYSYKESLELVKNGELDAAVISDLEETDEFLTFKLPGSERVLILHKNNPLSLKKELEIKDLKNEDFILCINDFARASFMRLCRENGFEPHIRRTSDTVYMYELCDKDGLTGISIDSVSEYLLPKYTNLRAIPFKNHVFSYPLVLITRKHYPRMSLIREIADYITYSMNNLI